MKPDSRGYFGAFGGRYVPEVLIAALGELEREVESAFASTRRSGTNTTRCCASSSAGLRRYTNAALAAGASSARIALKREDLNHTGAHKINNTVGQALLARRMGKKRIIAETGAGQHGVATATVGAKFGIPVDVYMGALDVERQALNVTS